MSTARYRARFRTLTSTTCSRFDSANSVRRLSIWLCIRSIWECSWNSWTLRSSRPLEISISVSDSVSTGEGGLEILGSKLTRHNFFNNFHSKWTTLKTLVRSKFRTHYLTGTTLACWSVSWCWLKFGIEEWKSGGFSGIFGIETIWRRKWILRQEA